MLKGNGITMKLQNTVFMAGLLTIVACQASASIITNGDFATGDFMGWGTIGNVQVQPSSTGSVNQPNNFGSIPPPATHHAIFGSGTLPQDQLLGGTPASASSLENFLGLTGGTLATVNGAIVGSGSAIKQTFTASAGSQLSFNWNFFNDAEPRNPQQDMAFVILDSTFTFLANTHSPLVPSNSILFDETGYHSTLLNILSSGTHTLGFGIVDGGALGGSALAVTNVNAVPLPAACWLFLSGMVSLFKYSRQFKRA